jgi:hypothetical protein
VFWSTRPRKAATIAGAAVAGLVVLGSVLGSPPPQHPAASRAPVTRSAPAKPQSPQPAAKPPSPQPAAPQPAAADQILYRFSGTGIGNTTPFTAPADGDWHLSWAYTNGALFAGQPENFSVTEYNTDGTIDAAGGVLVNALAVGTGQPTATPVYGDPGTHYFSVNTEDASWQLVVVSGTS